MISLAIFLVSLWLIVNKQYVLDSITVFQYEPSTDIKSISQKTTFTDKGEFYFYASTPSVQSASEFNSNCERLESNNAILGCYTNRKIYVYNIENSQLEGIEEVTAAHETLHAIWDRLSDDERTRVGDLLEEAYAKINDDSLSKRMEYYARNEPGERLNELHSIIGTEYAGLSVELEDYYKKYFVDRSAVVNFHNNYEAVFDNLKSQSEALYQEIQTSKADIEARIKKYNQDIELIEADYNALQASLKNVDRTSEYQVNQYNAKVGALRTRSNSLEATRLQILSLQDSYNKKVDEYNKLVVASNNLVNSIDSTLQTSPSI